MQTNSKNLRLSESGGSTSKKLGHFNLDNHDKPVDGKSGMFYQQTWQVSSTVLMDRVNSIISTAHGFSQVSECHVLSLASSTKDHRYIKNVSKTYQNLSKCIKILLQTQ